MVNSRPWANALASLKPDAWCYCAANQRTQLQGILAVLGQQHLLDDTSVRKIMIFFNWPKVRWSVCLETDVYALGAVSTCFTRCMLRSLLCLQFELQNQILLSMMLCFECLQRVPVMIFC